MAERKRTPDILAELMAGSAATAESPPAPRLAPEKKTKAGDAKISPKKRSPGKLQSAGHAPPAHKDSARWDYLCASLQYYKGQQPAWRVRFENGRELDDWFIGPPIDEYLRQVGQEGWELCAASSGERLYGSGDTRQYYFKRPSR